MNKYFFVSFKSYYEKKYVGGGSLIVICSCSIERIDEALIDYYNKNAGHKADKVIITAITVLDKQTAAQLSKNFTDGAIIIDDGDKEDEVFIERWVARDKDGTLCLYIREEPPKKEKSVWDAEYEDFIELDGSLFPEVQWSDKEPTKVKLVIDK